MANTGKGSSAEDLMIKSEVETAISMLQTIFSKHQKGEMTLEQAKQLGADLLRTGYYLPTRSSKQGKIHIGPPPAEALDSLLIAMHGGQETLWNLKV